MSVLWEAIANATTADARYVRWTFELRGLDGPTTTHHPIGPIAVSSHFGEWIHINYYISEDSTVFYITFGILLNAIGSIVRLLSSSENWASRWQPWWCVPYYVTRHLVYINRTPFHTFSDCFSYPVSTTILWFVAVLFYIVVRFFRMLSSNDRENIFTSTFARAM